MCSPDLILSVPCIRIIGNMLAGNEKQTRIVVENGALIALAKLAGHPKLKVRADTCWNLSNICSEGTYYDLCKELGIFESLI